MAVKDLRKKNRSRNQRRFKKRSNNPTFPTCPQPFCLGSCSFDSCPGMGFGSRGCFQQACRDKAASLPLPGGWRSCPGPGRAHTAASLCNRQSAGTGTAPRARPCPSHRPPGLSEYGTSPYFRRQEDSFPFPSKGRELSLVKAISNSARFGNRGLLASLCDPAVSPG